LDEVITGFRLGLDGAQGYFGVQPDLSTFGKIIGGGLPVGAFGGRREVMSEVAPLGKVYQAGTLSGNPVAMAAGLCSLRSLQEQPSIYQQLESRGKRLAQGLRTIFKEAEIPVTVNQVGSLCCLYFAAGPVNNYADAKRSDTERYKRYFNAMLERGVYLSPSQFEALFLSAAHTADQIEWMLEAVQEIVEGGLLA
jgi:glutamate-1-semialdehyde 2,1-aminomutase